MSRRAKVYAAWWLHGSRADSRQLEMLRNDEGRFGVLIYRHEQKGFDPEAIAELEKIRSPDTSRSVADEMGHVYALQGLIQEALRMIDELQRDSKQTYVDPWFVAPGL
jgi:hypothetical protein